MVALTALLFCVLSFIECSVSDSGSDATCTSIDHKYRARPPPPLARFAVNLGTILDVGVGVGQDVGVQTGTTAVFFVVAAGQRVADAVSDFALRHAATKGDSVSDSDSDRDSDSDSDRVQLEELYWAVCAQLQQERGGGGEGGVACECDSPRASRLVASIKVPVVAGGQEEEEEAVMYVRAGYSPDALVHFHCLATAPATPPSSSSSSLPSPPCPLSAERFQHLSNAVAGSLRRAAVHTWKHVPFALLEGEHLLGLLQYRLTEMQTDPVLGQYCSHFRDRCAAPPRHTGTAGGGGGANAAAEEEEEECAQAFMPSLLYMCRELGEGEGGGEVSRALRRAADSQQYHWTPPLGRPPRLALPLRALALAPCS
jgi:hypothetical protein